MGEDKDPYGFELIIDLHNCNVSKFNRKNIKDYFKEICKEMGMKRENMYFWDDVDVEKEYRQTSPITKGTSAVQFILTSTIVVHTLNVLKSAYVNIFSCKPFDKDLAEELTKKWFEAEKHYSYFIKRR